MNKEIVATQSSNVIPFKFKANEVRVLTDERGEPWFIAKDVADILGYSDAHKMCSKLDDDEKSNRKIGGLGSQFGGRGTTIINEAGLYTCILTSQKEEAKQFKRWVTHDVLPSIRKTGSFSVPAIEQKSVKQQVEVNRLFKSNLSVAKLFFKGNEAILSANKATARITGVDVLESLGAARLISEVQTQDLIPGDIGKILGNISAQAVNKALLEAGFQTSFRNKKNQLVWELTEAGCQYGRYTDTGKKDSSGKPIKQIIWSAEVVDILKAKGEFEGRAA